MSNHQNVLTEIDLQPVLNESVIIEASREIAIAEKGSAVSKNYLNTKLIPIDEGW